MTDRPSNDYPSIATKDFRLTLVFQFFEPNACLDGLTLREDEIPLGGTKCRCRNGRWKYRVNS